MRAFPFAFLDETFFGTRRRSGARARWESRVLPCWILLVCILSLTWPAVASAESPSGKDQGPLPSISEDREERAGVHLERAKVLESWEMWEKALSQYRVVLELSGDGARRADAHYGEAFCLFRLGRYEEALKSLDEISPEDVSDPAMMDVVEDARKTILRAREQAGQTEKPEK